MRTRRRKKRMWLIWLNLILVVMLGVAGFFAYHVYRDYNVNQFIKSQQEKIEKAPSSDVQKGNVGTTYVTAYFPKDAEGKRISSIETLVNERIKEQVGEQHAEGKIEKIFFISTKEEATSLPNVRKVSLFSETHKVDLWNVKKIRNKEEGSVLLTEDNQVFTFESLFSNVELAKTAFSTKLTEDLKAKGVAETDIPKQVEAFKAVDWKTVDFSYADSKVNLTLPTELAGVTTLSVPVASLFKTFKTDYMSETDKAAYKAFQEEEAKKNQNRVALTFDDGPNPATTTQILDTLKRHNIKATFFILGQNVPGNEALLKRMVAEGHEVANHSYTHPNLTGLSTEQVKEEINKTQEVIKAACGKTPTIMRPPYGEVNQAVMQAMKLPAIYWSVDSQDWKSRNSAAILAEVKAQTQPGGIILMHDIHQPTADALESVIQHLQSQGYGFATVSDLCGGNLDPTHVYYDQKTSRPAP